MHLDPYNILLVLQVTCRFANKLAQLGHNSPIVSSLPGFLLVCIRFVYHVLDDALEKMSIVAIS